MKQKNKELIRALFDLQPANTNLLANHLNVSVRSIKNYVREINEEYPEAIHSSREGYRLDKMCIRDSHTPNLKNKGSHSPL